MFDEFLGTLGVIPVMGEGSGLSGQLLRIKVILAVQLDGGGRRGRGGVGTLGAAPARILGF